MSLDELARTSTAALLDATTTRTDTVNGRAALRRTVQRRRVASMAAVAAGAAAVLVFGSLVLLRPTSPPVPRPAAPTGPGGVVVHCGGLLCTVDPTTGAVQKLTPWPGMASADEIAGVSPDGTEVAYVNRDHIELAQLYGQPTDKIRTAYLEASVLWTATGVRVGAVVGTRSGLRLHITEESGGKVTQRMVYPIDLPLDPAQRVLQSWSPDGLHMAFSAVDQNGDRRLYVTDANGQNVHELSTPKDHQVLEVAWSPDGKHIAYVESINPVFHNEPRAPGDSLARHGGHLIVIDPDGSDRTDLGSVGASVEPTGGLWPRRTTGSALAWSPDSQSIAFQGEELETPGWALYIRQLDGTTRRFDVPLLSGFSLGWAADSASTP
jgi:hypothetical protein